MAGHYVVGVEFKFCHGDSGSQLVALRQDDDVSHTFRLMCETWL